LLGKKADMKIVSNFHRIQGLTAYVNWLEQVPWQLFCTFTFAWQISDHQAVRVFKEFVNRLEKSVRTPIAFVRGDEKRFSGCGKPGAPRHFHALMTADRFLDGHMVADLWMSMAGRRKNGAGAHVLIYDPSLGGLAYVLKFIDQPMGDWDLRNVDLFLGPSEQRHLNARKRRRLGRHTKRLGEKTFDTISKIDLRLWGK
jgi:hypothetical protein